MTFEDLCDRRVPLAMLAALLMQAGTAIWWAASKEADDRFQQQRLDHLEQSVSTSTIDSVQALERLSRIEERTDANAHTLDRIEKQLAEWR